MTYSSSRGGAGLARDIDDMIAAEWDLEILTMDEPLVDGRLPYDGPTQAEIEAQQQAELEQIVEEAYLRGVEDGRRAGEEAEAARLRHAVGAAERALDEIREGEERWSGSIEENVCALATAIARQIIEKEIKSDQTLIEDLIRRALKEFPIDQPLRIRINPLDLVAINSIAGGDKPLSAPGEREMTWIADGRIAPGGVMVEGRDRIVDGRIDTAIERVYRRLTYAHV
jgi:flagellar assembly protein FliH